MPRTNQSLGQANVNQDVPFPGGSGLTSEILLRGVLGTWYRWEEYSKGAEVSYLRAPAQLCKGKGAVGSSGQRGLGGKRTEGSLLCELPGSSLPVCPRWSAPDYARNCGEKISLKEITPLITSQINRVKTTFDLNQNNLWMVLITHSSNKQRVLLSQDKLLSRGPGRFVRGVAN